MKNNSLYILRYSLPPDPVDLQPTRLELLARFCDEARIDEVMFFIMPEEYNRGQWRPSDYRPWLELAQRGREMVEATGRRVSLNPWHTLLHTDRGRTSPDLAYRRMVLDTGYECLSVACPLCEKWRAIFSQAFTDFAAAGFKTIWVEDDFRFHNHNGPLGWGGCFCPEHLHVLRQRGAQARSREELLANLNAPGHVHPDRLVWLDLNRDTYCDLARLTRAAVDAVDPSVRLGLMTSHIAAHTIEGRDWPALIEALGGADRTPIRPHGASYQESCRESFMTGAGNLSMTHAVLPRGARTYFEIENAPMSSFAKSGQQTAMQMAYALAGGCAGLSLDVLDFIGTGPASDPAMAATLAGNRQNLLKIREVLTDATPLAIEAILPTTTTRFAPGHGVATPAALPTIQYGWQTYLQAFGYPCCNRPDAGPNGVQADQIFALAGDAVWAIPDETLDDLLTSAITLLDPVAAEIIQKRGRAELIGMEEITWHSRHTSQYSMEEAIEPLSGGIADRATVNIPEANYRVATFRASRTTQPLTRIIDCYDATLGIGTFLFHNAQGGRGLILPTILPLPSEFYVWPRKRWLDRALASLANPLPMPFLSDAPWIYLQAFRISGGHALFVANPMFEIYNQLTIQLPPTMASPGWFIAARSRFAPPAGQTFAIDTQGRLRIEAELVGNDWLLLVNTEETHDAGLSD